MFVTVDRLRNWLARFPLSIVLLAGVPVPARHAKSAA
jgi:hypothetical protein